MADLKISAMIPIPAPTGKEILPAIKTGDTANYQMLAAASKGYFSWVGFLNQGGTLIPTDQVLRNELSDNPIIWARVNPGRYTGTLAGKFTLGKTIVIPLGMSAFEVSNSKFVKGAQSNVNVIYINTDDNLGPADGILDGYPIEIRVYL